MSDESKTHKLVFEVWLKTTTGAHSIRHKINSTKGQFYNFIIYEKNPVTY